MAYLLKFGGYTFPLSLRPSEEQGAQDLAAQQRPRAEGAVTQIGRRMPTTLPIRGELTAADADTLHALHAALKTAVYAGKQSLWFGRDDRYYQDAQIKSFSTSYADGQTYGLFATYALTFEASDHPLPLSATGQTAALGTAGATVTNPGDASALPAWTVTIGVAGTGPITLANSTTGETCTLTPAASFAAGDVIALTRDGYTVTLNGAADFGLLSGRIPTLAAGANTITLTAGGTATVGSASVAYTPRYF